MARTPDRGGTLKAWLIRFGQLALTALVTWYVLGRVGVDWSTFQQLDLAEWQPNVFLLAASALLLLVAMFMNAALWARVTGERTECCSEKRYCVRSTLFHAGLNLSN